MPDNRFAVDAVEDPKEPGTVLYWRWTRAGKSLGAISHKPDGWHALAYRRNGDNIVTDLGYHDTQADATAALHEWAERNPAICTCNPGGARGGLYHLTTCEMTGRVGA